MNSQELLELGLTNAGNKLKHKEDLRKNLAIAYECYRFVTPEIFKRFNDALQSKTGKKNEWGGTTYDKLVFTPLEQYPEAPPKEVLGELKIAKQRNCFDTYEVAKIETIEERPDPILFGCVNGCDDKFFISQWDNDVKIEDILQGNEG